MWNEMEEKCDRRGFLVQAGRCVSALLAGRMLPAGCLALGSSVLTSCTERRSLEELAKRLVVGIRADIRTLDPAFQDRQLDGAIIANIQENLTWYDRELKLVPRLAESWESPDSGKTWVFHLRKGIKFHDGSDFNAEAAAFHFKRLMDPKTGSLRLSRFEHVGTIDTTDDFTLRFQMKIPFSVWPEVIRDPFGCIACPTAVKSCKNQKDYTKHPVGTGPFEFVEYIPAQRILLRRNPKYWGGDVIKFEELEFRIIKEPTTRLVLLEQGQIDMTDIAATHVEVAKETGKIKIEWAPRLSIRYIGLNTQKPPFSDVRVRRAANYAINRDDIVKYVFHSNADPSLGPIPPSLPCFNKEMQTYNYDPEKAKSLMKEAGHESGIDVTLWGTDSPEDAYIAGSVIEQLRASGIRVNVKQLDDGAYWTLFDKYLTPGGKSFPTAEGIFDMFIGGWTGGETAFGYLNPLYRSASYSNNAFYSNPEVDKTLNEVMNATDPAARDILYKKLQAMIVADAPWLFLYHQRILKGLNPRVRGFKVNQSDEFEFQNVTLDGGDKA